MDHTAQPISLVAPYKPQGYHRLANLMSRDKSIAIFRRFDALNILNILSLQTEIYDLQRQYEAQCKKDGLSRDSVKANFAKDFYLLRQSKDAEQYNLLNCIREKIVMYSESARYVTRLSANKSESSDQLVLQGKLLQSIYKCKSLPTLTISSFSNDGYSQARTFAAEYSARMAF